MALGRSLASILVLCVCVWSCTAWQRTKCGVADQITKWGKTVTPANVLPAYPRPQMMRPSLSDRKILNGLWDIKVSETARGEWDTSAPTQILVPFPVESCLSGIGVNYMYLDYATNFDDFADRQSTDRVLLHFGAVDWQANVSINGKMVGTHTGGFDSFSFDITSFVKSSNTLEVSVFDPSDRGVQPNGKQRVSAIHNPGGDTYTPTTGIWQTVWLERVPQKYISKLTINADLTNLRLQVDLGSNQMAEALTAIVLDGNTQVARLNGKTGQQLQVAVPNAKLWSPDSPFLYNLNITLASGDFVRSYFGMRTFTLGKVTAPPTPATGPQPGIDRPGYDLPGYPIKLNASNPVLCQQMCDQDSKCKAWAYGVPGCDSYKDPMCWLKSSSPRTSKNKCRVSGAEGYPGGPVAAPFLNGKPIFLAGWLDQSFWPDGIYTAPTDAALAFDLQAVKMFGLNFVRLHQKVNPERWYYFADTMGIIIWQDAPQKYGGASKATIPYFMHDLTEMIKGKWNHPSIVQWDIFNEGDCVGVFTNVTEMVSYVAKLDPSRLVDTNSGGPANNLHVGNVNDIHSYPYPGHPEPSLKQYAAIGEFGGIGAFVKGKEWVPNRCHTYLRVSTPSDEAKTYEEMTKTILAEEPKLSACVYTQITDVELECDGFLNYDRTNKFSAADTQGIRAVNQELIKKQSYRRVVG